MNEQIDAMINFEKYIIPLWTVFPRALKLNNNNNLDKSSNINGDVNNNESKNKTQNSSFNLNTFLYRQKLILHGVERKRLKLQEVKRDLK